MSASKAARLVWIHGGRNADPRTVAYFLSKLPAAPAVCVPEREQA